MDPLLLDSAYEGAVPHSIPSLFTNFYTAATILRIARARGELEESDHLQRFYDRLDVIEKDLQYHHTNNYNRTTGRRDGSSPSSTSSSTSTTTTVTPFVVLIEGLDGSGKSSLVASLAEQIGGIATRTPSRSLKETRDIFDKRGGSVARAYYMVSNYVLQQEIREYCQQQQQQEDNYNDDMNHKSKNKNKKKAIFVVDRWYTSTCAYSIGQSMVGGPAGIDALEEFLFQWPHDLDPPHLLLQIHVDHEVRRKRIQSRHQQQQQLQESEMDGGQHNDWDDRLSRDNQLCQRIERAFSRINGPIEKLVIDGNPTKEDVLKQALTIVQDRIHRHYQPEEYFQNRPMAYFQYCLQSLSSSSSFLNANNTTVLNDDTSQRNIFVSENMPQEDCFPSTTMARIVSIDDLGIVFSANKPIPNSLEPAWYMSLMWQPRFYYDRQSQHGGGCSRSSSSSSNVCWKMEGVCTSITPEECKSFTTTTTTTTKMTMTPMKVRSSDFYYRCSPLTIQYREDNENNIPAIFTRNKLDGDWSKDEFSSASPSSLFNESGITLPNRSWISPPKPITLAIFGTHCAGKSTISSRLAELLDWTYDRELGDMLRDRHSLATNGHKLGDGSGKNTTTTTTTGSDGNSWDEHLLREECARDVDRRSRRNPNHPISNRVVESWHVGNFAWASLRWAEHERQQSQSQCETETVTTINKGEGLENLCQKYGDAITHEMKKALVLVVNLQATPETSLRRRHRDTSNQARLPLLKEEDECVSLHKALELDAHEFIRQFHSDSLSSSSSSLTTGSSRSHVPMLTIDNNQDGEEGMQQVLRNIVEFIHQNRWRACV